MLGGELIDDRKRVGDPVGRVDDDGEDGDAAAELEQAVTVGGAVAGEPEAFLAYTYLGGYALVSGVVSGAAAGPAGPPPPA